MDTKRPSWHRFPTRKRKSANGGYQRREWAWDACVKLAQAEVAQQFSLPTLQTKKTQTKTPGSGEKKPNKSGPGADRIPLHGLGGVRPKPQGVPAAWGQSRGTTPGRLRLKTSVHLDDP